jgi:DNA-binding winged helix-turn-helix (wHTH) protein/tetratricopeptide (TPR) repeat protein
MAVQHPRARLLRFGVFELDLESREVRRRGRLVALPPQPFTVLATLASHAGRIVTREELRRLLWPDGVHVDHERGLNHCLNRIRRVLGDTAQSPRFVETLPRQGYRFLADVDTVRDESEPAALPAPPAAFAAREIPVRRRATPALVLAATLVLALQSPGTTGRSRAGQHGLPSRDPAAQAAFETGRRLLDEGPTGWRRSVPLFEEAARRDRGFALAWYALADAYMRLGERGALAPEQAFPAARRAVEAALAIEDRAEPRVILGALELNYDWDWAGAERTYRRALELDPELTDARIGLARLLSAAGRHDEALRTARETEASHPGRADVVRDSAFVHYRARRFDDAERRLQDWAALQPDRREPHHYLALLYLRRGRPHDAVREGRVVYALAQADARFVAGFEALAPRPAMEYYLRGSIGYLERLGGSQWVTMDEFARLRALLGETNAALAGLERAADERSPRLLTSLGDPAFDAVRDQPRFQALLRRVGAPGHTARPAALALVPIPR